MKFTTFVTFGVFATSVFAHSTVWGVWKNGQYQGDGVNQYIRSPPNNSPVKDLKSSAMACNVNNRVVPQWVNVVGGDKITFEWYHDTRGVAPAIDTSHEGPIQVYIAPASSNGAGSVWTKLFSESYVGGSWAVDKFNAAGGKHTIIIPNIQAGDYLLRPEIIGLHEADVPFSANNARGAQFYPSCTQIRVTSQGNVQPPGGIAFPGIYTDSTPGVVFNLYGGNSATYMPWPPVWKESPGGWIGA